MEGRPTITTRTDTLLPYTALYRSVAEAGVKQTLGERHADGVGEALAERAGGGLDAGGVAVFRVPGRAAAELEAVLQLLQRHVFVAGEVPERIQQPGAVAQGENEAVAVHPRRFATNELQDSGKTHGCVPDLAQLHAGVVGISLIHALHTIPQIRL